MYMQSQGQFKVGGQTKVGDLVKAGGKDYSLLSDNCQHAANRMMNEGHK